MDADQFLKSDPEPNEKNTLKQLCSTKHNFQDQNITHDSQTLTSSTTYVAFVTVNGFSRLKLLRILWPWLKGDGFGSSGSPPNGCTLLRSTTYRTTLVKLNDAPISWFWAVAISWIFPHPTWIVSYVLAGSQPYNFNTSCDPAYRHSPPWLK